MKQKRWLALALALTLLLSGCGSKSDSSASEENNGDWQMSDAQFESGVYGSASSFDVPGAPEADSPAEAQGRKLILTASLTLETTDFDGAAALLEQRTGELGGWIENAELQGSSRYDSARYGWYTLRIPAAKLEEFLSGTEEIGNVLSMNRRQEEITTAYYDTEARLNSLKTQEERLLAILEKAESLDDVIRLESALSDVRYQIEDLTGTLKRYDSLVEMATVDVSLQEVSSTTPVSVTPKTLGERIAQAFENSLRGLGRFGENVLVFFVGNLPVLLVLALVVTGGVFAGRKLWRKRKEKEAKEE